MREEVRYYAYDDTEFFDRAECEAYEANVYNMLTSVSEKCTFFDEDLNIFLPPSNSLDIDDWMNFFDEAFNGSHYVYRAENLTDEEDKFINYEFGYWFYNSSFNNEIGWFYWDKEEAEWVKMDE